MSDSTTSPAPAPIAGQQLSERGKLRLRIAAGLLRAEGVRFDVPRDQFYETIQRVLSDLDPERQARLKGLVDWVEDYDRHDAASQAAPSSSPTSPKTSRGR